MSKELSVNGQAPIELRLGSDPLQIIRIPLEEIANYGQRLEGLVSDFMLDDRTIDLISVEEAQSLNIFEDPKTSELVPVRVVLDLNQDRPQAELQLRYYPHATLAESAGRTGIIARLEDSSAYQAWSGIAELVGDKLKVLVETARTRETI